MRATAQHYSLPPVFTRPILTYYRGSGKPIKHSKSPFLPPDLRCCYDTWEVGVIAARLPRRDVWYFLFTFFSSCLISSTRLDRLAGGEKNHTATRNLSIQPHFGYANTTSLLNLTEQTLQRRNDKSRLFALSGCLRLPWLQQKNSFLEKTDRNGADWCFVDFKKK